MQHLTKGTPMARTPFDYDLHIKGVENAIDKESFEVGLPALATPASDKAERNRRKASSDRAGQGDRVDWKRHLGFGLPRRYRLVPDECLNHSTKVIRTRSLRAAAERRKRVRDEHGVVLSLSATEENRDIMSSLALSRRWDRYDDFGDHCDEEVTFLDYLFRYGSAGRSADVGARRAHLKSDRRPIGWFVD